MHVWQTRSNPYRRRSRFLDDRAHADSRRRTSSTAIGSQPPFPDGLEHAMFGMGCFWGAERKFWQLRASTRRRSATLPAHTPNPTYREVCTGMTGHNEAVLVVFDPKVVSYEDLLKTFWESHDPTQGMRQGNDAGTQYRSGIYYYDDAQQRAAEAIARRVPERLKRAGYGTITTEILPAPEFYYAEDYHQQYLAKNPGGYCGLGGTGVSCPVGVAQVDRRLPSCNVDPFRSIRSSLRFRRRARSPPRSGRHRRSRRGKTTRVPPALIAQMAR